MAETLGQKQRRFSRLLASLIARMNANGYEVSLGEVKRSDEQAEINALGEAGRARVAALVKAEFPLLAEKVLNNGKANGVRASTHQYQVAADINLFKNGVFLPDTESHREFGEWWEKQGADCRWGGRFRDGGHYSIEHNGVK